MNSNQDLSNAFNSLKVEEFSSLYKFTFLILTILCIYVYKKKKINEQIEDHLNLFSFTWICMGLLIASVFCFIGSKTDTFYEVTFNSMAVFMALYYLYSQYAGARNKKMTFMQWGLLSLFAFINILFIILTPKEMTILIVLTESIITILIENKKST